MIVFLYGEHCDNGANHLGNDDHVAQVRLDGVGLLVGLGLLLGLAQLLDQAQRAALETAVEPAAGARVHDVAQLLGREVEEPIERPMHQLLLLSSAVTFLCACRLWFAVGSPSSCHVLIEFDAAVGELAEGPLPAGLCS